MAASRPFHSRRAGRPRALAGLAALAVLVLLAGGVVAGSGCSDCDLRVSTRMLPDATVGIRYDVPLTSNCGGDDWFLDAGTLPPGIGLEEDGDLAGIPTLPGLYTFTVGVFDYSSGEAAYKGLSITVLGAAPTPTATPG
jgi:hypothetical protein